MNKLLISLGVLLFAQFVCSRFTPVPFKSYNNVYQSSKERVLTFVADPWLSFVSAEAACAARGAVLAEFRDAEDVKFLNEAIKNKTMPGLTNGWVFYAGGMYVGPITESKKGFQWIESGSEVTLWGPNEPSNLVRGAEEYCTVVYKIASSTEWAIGDHTCVPKRPFVCSAPAPFA